MSCWSITELVLLSDEKVFLAENPCGISAWVAAPDNSE